MGNQSGLSQFKVSPAMKQKTIVKSTDRRYNHEYSLNTRIK